MSIKLNLINESKYKNNGIKKWLCNTETKICNMYKGTRNAETCTLIITEGDSAKALAMSGIEVVGRDKFGVFPLKGKMLNVRDSNSKQITDNIEI